MTKYLDFTYNLDDSNLVNNYDELSLWAAPFGLTLLNTFQYKLNSNVLDIGPGSGFPFLEIAQRLGPSSRVYGVDPWKAAIKRIKEKIEYLELNNAFIIEGIAEGNLTACIDSGIVRAIWKRNIYNFYIFYGRG